MVLSMLFGLSSFLWNCWVDFSSFFLNSFISFCACVSGSMLYLEMNGMPGWVLGDIFFGLYRFSGVCPSGWGHTSICHSCHSHPPMHVSVRNGLPFHLCCSVRYFWSIRMQRYTLSGWNNWLPHFFHYLKRYFDNYLNLLNNFKKNLQVSTLISCNGSVCHYGQ